MEKYSAAYSYTNYNFVIQNIKGNKDINNKYYPLICVVKNILQRGCPTYMSDYLTEKIGNIDLTEKNFIGLIDNELPNWVNVIKGDNTKNYFPAKIFFEELIPRYFGEYKFIQQLIIPEAKISDIIGKEDEDFINQQVDFYLHQCKLVIEIDGCQHNDGVQLAIDRTRDEYLEKNNIKIVRITTHEINTQNESFIEKVEQIKAILSSYKHLKIYKEPFELECKYNANDLKYLKANSIIRIQLTILSLLEKGILKLNDDIWKFNILQRDVHDFVDIAIEDLFLWFANLCNINQDEFTPPKIKIKNIKEKEEFVYIEDYINIDFSLKKRYTDENELEKKIIFVRTDYFDKRKYFRVSTTDPICYKINKEDINCIESLKFFLKNIFRHDDFRNGQLSIIMNSLEGEDTLGILPTGSGKSICYQLVALLQPCISYVVCPITSLIYDQKTNLEKCYIVNVESITSDMNGDEKGKVINSFSNEEYQFLFITPERFQIKNFRESLEELNSKSTVALAVIDEVHCLSEWGHDFRTSYLNLVKTIRYYTPSARFLGLTATASNFVLQDIKREFEIDNYNIKTLTSFTREELNFKVIKCNNNKKKILFELIKDKNNIKKASGPNEEITESGIIFTSTVNNERGCYDLSNKINIEFGKVSNYYSGAKPKKELKSINYNDHKKKVQNNFINDKIPLLVATKAFGMGIDKPNIRYTIHFNMPMSLESLYQEAGRAGRDKKKADCYVLYEHETIDDKILNKFFDLDTPVEELKDMQTGIILRDQKDILSNFYLWLINNHGIDFEFNVIRKIFHKYGIENTTQIIKCSVLEEKLFVVQKAIYRLSVVGIVNDWTVENWSESNGILQVDFGEFNVENVQNNMEEYIKKYHKEFNFGLLESNKIDTKSNDTFTKMVYVLNDESIETDVERIIKSLLIWTYDNIIYTRRQSIKTISDLCNNFSDEGSFKMKIENHFKFDEDTFIFDEIAENPSDYSKWFEIFYDKDNKFNSSNIENLKGTLGRFLESYRYNTGLNFISGIIRLLTNDYNDKDGKQRLESAFNQIREYDQQMRDEILNFCLKIGYELDYANKLHFSELLCNNYNDRLKIYEAFTDEYSLLLIMDDMNNKLENITRGIRCQTLKS